MLRPLSLGTTFSLENSIKDEVQCARAIFLKVLNFIRNMYHAGPGAQNITKIVHLVSIKYFFSVQFIKKSISLNLKKARRQKLRHWLSLWPQDGTFFYQDGTFPTKIKPWFVVYFEKCLGAAHLKHWLICFNMFFAWKIWKRNKMNKNKGDLIWACTQTPVEFFCPFSFFGV